MKRQLSLTLLAKRLRSQRGRFCFQCPLRRRLRQISFANSRRFSLGVSWMTSPPSSWAPRLCSTAAETYCASVSAPGLNWRVRLPCPAFAIASPNLVLQDLQSQRTLEGESLCSSPSRWSATRNRVEPHRAQRFGAAGIQRCARYRCARSVIWSPGLRNAESQAGDGPIPPMRLLRPLRLHLTRKGLRFRVPFR